MFIFIWSFGAIILYYTYRFIQVLLKMRQEILLPITAEEMSSIRKEPHRKLKAPNYSSQKNGIIFYFLLLLYIIALFIFLWNFRQDMVISAYLLILYPLLFSGNLLNLFAFTNDGVIASARFVPWKRIKSYEFKRIDVNHKYYGHSKEVNDKFELRIKTRFWTYNCIVINEEMKEKIHELLEKYSIEEKLEEKLVRESEV